MAKAIRSTCYLGEHHQTKRTKILTAEFLTQNDIVLVDYIYEEL